MNPSIVDPIEVPIGTQLAELWLFYVAMTRSKNQLDILVPQHFYVQSNRAAAAGRSEVQIDIAAQLRARAR